MARQVKKVVVGRKNTVNKAIPKSLFRLIVSIQKDMQTNINNKGKGKVRRVTFLEAGVELSRRVRK